MEKTLRRIIIGSFIFILLAGILFAMSVDGPGMPSEKLQGDYMMEYENKNVSCFFPFFGCSAEESSL